MRVVVLDRDARHAPARGEPRRVPRAEEIGMQVVRDELRLDVEDRHEVRDRVDQRRAGRRVVEVADVLRHERLVAARHADGVLEIAAEREHRRPGAREPDRSRRVAAGAADELDGAAAVAARSTLSSQRDDDVAVVHEERVGDAGEPRDAPRRCR